ncbi:hypothetical protein KM043_015531 [Ampulex compressa]|nr:hypothetical protein KM043_015531 [Ampulex compressa]
MEACASSRPLLLRRERWGRVLRTVHPLELSRSAIPGLSAHPLARHPLRGQERGPQPLDAHRGCQCVGLRAPYTSAARPRTSPPFSHYSSTQERLPTCYLVLLGTPATDPESTSSSSPETGSLRSQERRIKLDQTAGRRRANLIIASSVADHKPGLQEATMEEEEQDQRQRLAELPRISRSE